VDDVKLRTERLTWREIDGEAVILDLGSSTYFSTNRSGTLLLRRLVDERTRDELVDTLVQSYEISHERATSDVDAFVQILSARGLIDETDRH
jgi:hypothetical protein